MQLVGGLKDLINRTQTGTDPDYYWEDTPEDLAARKPAASSVIAPTTDDIKPNNEPETVRKKRKRNLTIQPQDEGSGLAQILASIGLNIPT